MTENEFKSKGNGSYLELAGLFELSEFELPGFYCTFMNENLATILFPTYSSL